MNRILTFLSLALFTISAYPQGNSQLSGIITSEKSGEPLPGINIVINKTTLGAASDLDGRYIIKNLPQGTYTITVSGIGYTAKSISEYKIEKSQKYALNVALAEQSYNTGEVLITAEKIKSS